jgi:Family of unknown function (DUF6152)
MKKRFPLASTVALLVLAAVSPSFAHHGTAGYDMSKTITLTGTVAKYEWSNPHITLYVDAKDEKGQPQRWSLELSAPLLMKRFGWSSTSMKVGDQIVAEAHPSRNGAPVGISGTATFLLKFVINGTELPHL